MEKDVADNLSCWEEFNNKFNRQQKNKNTNVNLFKLFETTKYGFRKGHLITGIFVAIGKAFDQVWFDGVFFKQTLMGLSRKLIGWIRNFLYLRKLMINNQPIDQNNSIHGVPQGSHLSPIPFIL